MDEEERWSWNSKKIRAGEQVLGVRSGKGPLQIKSHGGVVRKYRRQ